MQTAEQEKEIALSQQSNKLEQAKRREQEESQQREQAQDAQEKVTGQLESLLAEVDQLKETAEQEKKALERKVREAQDEVRLLEEQLQDLSNAKDEAARMSDKKISDCQIQMAALEKMVQEHGQESNDREHLLQHTQSQVAERDDQIAALEADVLRFKAQSGDAETMQAIKNELTEQVQHIRALEATNRDQLSELKHLRSINKATEIVEEEKRTLQRRLEVVESLETELAESRMQRQRLEDERRSWSTYLQGLSSDGDAEFDSPEGLARAFAHERLTTASQLDQLGSLRGEITALQNTIQSMEDDRAQLQDQVEQAKSIVNASSADKAQQRLDRQRQLALKEVEYLRAQVKAAEAEDQAMQPEQFDEETANKRHELEVIIDEYKLELQSIHKQISSTEHPLQTPLTPQPLAGNKRAQPDDYDSHEQLGQLSRKNRKLQEEMAALQTKIAMQEKELAASNDQLAIAKVSGQTRILSLRSNPTSDHEAIKQSTLDALQKENKDLLATLRSKHSNPTVPVIPTSVLSTMEREIAAAKAETASAQKSARRLKEVWGSKSQEFKEAIFSTLGWTVTFIPNGKMRVESTFFPSQTDEHENSIVFDGERGTMKVGGGPKSAFAQRISDQIGFWVREKGCIPGFLAALTLEFYEEYSKSKS